MNVEVLMEFPGIASVVEKTEMEFPGIASIVEVSQFQFPGFDTDAAEPGSFLLFLDSWVP